MSHVCGKVRIEGSRWRSKQQAAHTISQVAPRDCPAPAWKTSPGCAFRHTIGQLCVCIESGASMPARDARTNCTKGHRSVAAAADGTGSHMNTSCAACVQPHMHATHATWLDTQMHAPRPRGCIGQRRTQVEQDGCKQRRLRGPSGRKRPHCPPLHAALTDMRAAHNMRAASRGRARPRHGVWRAFVLVVHHHAVATSHAGLVVQAQA